MKDGLLLDLRNALFFIGNAQERAVNQSALWKELGKMFDDLDSLNESVNEGDYDKDILES